MISRFLDWTERTDVPMKIVAATLVWAVLVIIFNLVRWAVG